MTPGQPLRHAAAADLEDWEVNLRRAADDAAKLITEWTDDDIASFLTFMSSFSPEAVQAFHGQRPSRHGGGSDD